MAVTIRQVAAAAGVSPMAVSKVLHDRGSNVRVSEPTADLIRKVARELNYQPNQLARSLRHRRTKNLGLLFEKSRPLAQSRYFVHLFDGVILQAFELGYSVTVCPSLVNTDSSIIIDDGRFDGLIWCQLEVSPAAIAAIDRATIPLVMLHAHPRPELTNLNIVTCDNQQALDLAVEHLAQLGHRQLAFVVESHNAGTEETLVRRHAFVRSCEKLGLPPGPILLWDQGAEAFSEWWATKPSTTALIARSEVLGLAILKSAQSAGVRVPEDLSVIGFDSTDDCEHSQPPLTSIRQPIESMAQEAVRLLVAAIEDRDLPPIHHVHPCGFDVRSSTAVPRQS